MATGRGNGAAGGNSSGGWRIVLLAIASRLLIADAALAGWLVGGLACFAVGLLDRGVWGVLALAVLFVAPVHVVGCATVMAMAPAVLGRGDAEDGDDGAEGEPLLAIPSVRLLAIAFVAGIVLAVGACAILPVEAALMPSVATGGAS